MPENWHLKNGGLIFPKVGQCDFAGPFEVLSRIPNSTFHTLWKDKGTDQRLPLSLLSRRIDCGGCPYSLTKALRIRSGSVNPTARAICSMGSLPSCKRSRAASTRKRSTALAGVSPVSRRNARPNCLGLKFAASASRSTGSASVKCSLAKFSAMRMRSDSGSICDMAENWD